MTTYTANLNLSAVADLLRNADEPIVVITHAKPDGDAFGSVIALSVALRSLGRSVTPCFVPPVPVSLLGLRGADQATIYRESLSLPDAGLYVILDTGAWSQLGELKQVIEPNLERTLILDHHLSGDIPAAHRYIDGKAAAACEIVAELLEHFDATTWDVETTRTISEALFVGIASDTGWFRFSNTRPRTHELAAKLLRQGVDQAALYQVLEQTERPEKLALLTRALDSLKLLANGQAAVMTLNSDDFLETGALEEETERLIDVPQQVGTIRVIVLVAEKRGNNEDDVITRLSFRSKPGEDAINVAELANRFGGGGHARAAGAKVPGPANEVVPKVEQALVDVLNHQP
ncbi:bifunctional oligoribonuclease/PAP phosphatase NrnA [Phycisphaerales bacterium AB-hyl4]|uniref:Bifunctional oligoribonuclease/PAP phosphatase NrnA n=1 Tax=Natronomicrosphaera hydrolytica TaxID=3242702 RepID=A0ABV4U3S8_9BACT